MKVSPRADYPVRVRPQAWDEDQSRADLYRGVFSVTLNNFVDIAFVPDVSAIAPPWDGRQLPVNLDDVSTVEQALLSSVLLATYAVTPNQNRAGDVAHFRWPADEGERAAVAVRYVTPDEFARYSAELTYLTTIVGASYSETKVSELRDYEVIRFVEREVVAAPWLGARDGVMLGRGAPAGSS